MMRAFLSLAEKMERFAIAPPLFTNIYYFYNFVNTIPTLIRHYSDIDGQVELLFGADDTENDTVAGGQTGGQIGGQKGPQFDRRCLSNLKKSGPNVPNV